jgi:hypothetical protein
MTALSYWNQELGCQAAIGLVVSHQAKAYLHKKPPRFSGRPNMSIVQFIV